MLSKAADVSSKPGAWFSLLQQCDSCCLFIVEAISLDATILWGLRHMIQQVMMCDYAVIK